MNITTASLSSPGGRGSNQDATGEHIGAHAACFVVCDGVAGQPGGDIAAKVAVNTILSHFDGDKQLNAQYIRRYIMQANEMIIRQQQVLPDCQRMGTTLVSLFIDRDRQQAYWAHAGDSRLYRFRQGLCEPLTTDHSLLEQMKAAGHQTDGVNTHLLYLALGMRGEASYSDAVALEDGDIFLLCTDGFWLGVGHKPMQQTLQTANSPQAWLMQMEQVLRACAGAEQDNYSAVAIWIGEPQQARTPQSTAERFFHHGD